jgi:hypothetical protein
MSKVRVMIPRVFGVSGVTFKEANTLLRVLDMVKGQVALQRTRGESRSSKVEMEAADEKGGWLELRRKIQVRREVAAYKERAMESWGGWRGWL